MGFAVVAGIPPVQMAQAMAEQEPLNVAHAPQPKPKRKTEPAASKAPADGMG
jgi:hypothetical protein